MWTESLSTSMREEVDGLSVCSTRGGAGARACWAISIALAWLLQDKGKEIEC